MSLRIFNVKDQEIVQLVNEVQSAGKYDALFDATYLNSGVYIYQLQTGNQIIINKMLFLK